MRVGWCGPSKVNQIVSIIETVEQLEAIYGHPGETSTVKVADQTTFEALADVRRAEGATDLERRELETALSVHRALASPRSDVIQRRLDQLAG